MGYWMQRAKRLRDEAPNVGNTPPETQKPHGQTSTPIQAGTLITWLSGDGQVRRSLSRRVCPYRRGRRDVGLCVLARLSGGREYETCDGDS